MLAAFFKDGVIYGLIKAVTSSSHLLLLPIYTRALSTEAYGVLDFLTITANLVCIIVSLEITQGFARFYCDAKSDEDKKGYASTTLWFSLAVYSLFLVISFVFSVELGQYVFESPGYDHVIQVAALAIWGKGIFSLVQNQLRYELRPKHYAFASLVYIIILLVTVVVLLVVLNFGVMGVFIAQLAASLSGLMVGIYFTRSSYRWIFDRDKCVEMLRFSLPLVLSSAGVFFALYMDRIAIKSLMSMNDLGVYSVGYRVATVISLALTGFQMALTPLIYRNYKNESAPKEIEQIFRVFVALVCPIILVATIFADDILSLMATPDYASAHQVVFVLGMAFVFSNIYLFAPGVWIAKKTGWITLINLVVAGINLVLNYVLIPYFGILGAALATCLSAFIGLSLYIILGQVLYPIPYRWFPIIASFSLLFLIGIPTMLPAGAWGIVIGDLSIVVKLLILLLVSSGIALILLHKEKRVIFDKVFRKLNP